MSSEDTLPESPAWIRYPARAVALIVVVPIRLVWELLRHSGRLVVEALSWAGVYLIWLPLRWSWSTSCWRRSRG